MLESRKKIDIPLKQIPTSLRGSIASQARSSCDNEYATRYLENIGVQATKDQRELLLSNLPIEKALVVPVWSSGSLCIVPERREEKDPYTIKQLYTGSKELDTSKKSNIENFYGKNVSAPGTKPPKVSNLKRLTTTKDTSNDDDFEERSPSIHATFPLDGYLAGQEACGKLFRKLLKPLAVSDVRLKMAVKSFSMNLSNFIPQIFDDPTGQLNVAIQSFIVTPICRRLYGLLCHYVYWNIVHPFAHKVSVVCRKQFPVMMFALANRTSTMSNSKGHVNNSRQRSMLSLTSSSFHHDDDEAFSSEDIKTFRSRSSLDIESSEDESDEDEDSINSSDQSIGGGMHGLGGGSVPGRTLHSNQRSTGTGSVASHASLSSEEKELLYLQLEDCISQMHAVMGYQQTALKCCRQSLVSACHFIVHDIICTHYNWFDEKRIAKRKSRRDKRALEAHNQRFNFPPLNTRDQKHIYDLKKGVLKCISSTLTELLDPARVYASRISKEMFDGEDITLREVTPKPKNDNTISHGHLRRPRESKDAHRKDKFTSTSLAIQAIFSSSGCCAETRKFLLSSNGGGGGRAKALSRLGKGRRSRPAAVLETSSLTESSLASSCSNGSNYSVDTSLEFSLANDDGGAHAEEKKTSSDDPMGSVKEFQSMLATHGIDPKKRSKLGLSQVDVDPEPKYLADLHLSDKFVENKPGQCNKLPPAATVRKATASSHRHKESDRQRSDEQFLSTTARGRLMTLVVGRSKSKYKDETLLQNSHHPNARYRKDLLSTGGNNSRLL